MKWSLRAQGWPLVVKLVLATLIVGAALLIRLGLEPYLTAYRALFFLPAILLSTLLLGRVVGLYTALLSTLVVFYFLTEPAYSFAIHDPGDGFGLALFLAICISVVLLVDPLQSALLDSVARARDAELHLAELQHRMRNNLQIATALLITQGRQASQETRNALRAAADRINNLARIQDRMSQAQSDGHVDSRAFVTGLCEDIRGALVGIRPIAFDVRAASEQVGADRMAPLGLIINELVTNALKYAFPDERSGALSVRFDRQGEEFVLTVADDGVGISGATPSKGSGLGAVLIRAMTGQLGGTLESGAAAQGTMWIVRFPRESKH